MTDIAALSSQARQLLPQLPVSDSIFTDSSATHLRKWRSRECAPAARAFKGDTAVTPQLPVTPRRRPRRHPLQPTILELTVYPDALETTPPYQKPGLLVCSAPAYVVHLIRSWQCPFRIWLSKCKFALLYHDICVRFLLL